MLRSLPRPLKRFARDDRGSWAFEAVIIMPMLVFGYLGMFIFFDAFRQQNVNLKAAYTLSDILTRQTTPVGPTWLRGLNQMLDYLTTSRHPTYVRVTMVRYDADSDRYVKEWSETSGGLAGLTQDRIDEELVPQIPAMADGTSTMILETFMLYEPMAAIGLGPVEFHNVVVTPPRFADNLCWEMCGGTGTVTPHDDGTGDGDGSIAG